MTTACKDERCQCKRFVSCDGAIAYCKCDHSCELHGVNAKDLK